MSVVYVSSPETVTNPNSWHVCLMACLSTNMMGLSTHWTIDYRHWVYSHVGLSLCWTVATLDCCLVGLSSESLTGDHMTDEDQSLFTTDFLRKRCMLSGENSTEPNNVCRLRQRLVRCHKPGEPGRGVVHPGPCLSCQQLKQQNGVTYGKTFQFCVFLSALSVM